MTEHREISELLESELDQIVGGAPPSPLQHAERVKFTPSQQTALGPQYGLDIINQVCTPR
jgi:hypothetical protein